MNQNRNTAGEPGMDLDIEMDTDNVERDLKTSRNRKGENRRGERHGSKKGEMEPEGQRRVAGGREKSPCVRNCNGHMKTPPKKSPSIIQ